MFNQFEGFGNLGSTPSVNIVNGTEEKKKPHKVCNIRVYFDRPVLDQKTNKYKDQGGFWLSVGIWGKRADEAARLLKKGSRIWVRGRLREESWCDASGEVKKEIRLTADFFSIDTLCIDSIRFKEKNPALADANAH